MKRLLAVAGLLTLVMTASSAADLPYLFDVMKKPAYKHSVDAMLSGQPVDPWVKGFFKNYDGVAGSGTAVTLGHAPYELYNVCEAHNCGGNFLYVLFTPSGGQAWAVFTKDDHIVRYYGHPDAAKQKFLDDATRQ